MKNESVMNSVMVRLICVGLLENEVGGCCILEMSRVSVGFDLVWRGGMKVCDCWLGWF